MKKIQALALLLATLTISLSSYANIKARKDVKDFIQEMVKKHQFESEELEQTFAKVTIRDSIVEAMNRPAEDKPWHQYQNIFLTDKRIKNGVKFWKKYEKDLNRAEKKYGVPAEIIVAILGVETFYGKHKGGYTVLDSLSTLAFNYPKRARFFKSELEAFLLLSREENIDGNKQKSSYAGAMGYPQFIASSYRHYAVDFSGDGKKDLINNPVDAIGSIANYFHAHGWKTGETIATKIKTTQPTVKLTKLGLNELVKPKNSINNLEKYGIQTTEKLAKDTKAVPYSFELKNGDSEYWLGLQNFYVITRYNRSRLYAMAVKQLSEEIVKAKQKSA